MVGLWVTVGKWFCLKGIFSGGYISPHPAYDCNLKTLIVKMKTFIEIVGKYAGKTVILRLGILGQKNGKGV